MWGFDWGKMNKKKDKTEKFPRGGYKAKHRFILVTDADSNSDVVLPKSESDK